MTTYKKYLNQSARENIQRQKAREFRFTEEGPGPHPSNWSTGESSEGREGPAGLAQALCGQDSHKRGLFKEGTQSVHSPPGLWEGAAPVGLVLRSRKPSSGTGCAQVSMLST